MDELKRQLLEHERAALQLALERVDSEPVREVLRERLAETESALHQAPGSDTAAPETPAHP